MEKTFQVFNNPKIYQTQMRQIEKYYHNQYLQKVHQLDENKQSDMKYLAIKIQEIQILHEHNCLHKDDIQQIIAYICENAKIKPNQINVSSTILDEIKLRQKHYQ